jgi:hypothetical protein
MRPDLTSIPMEGRDTTGDRLCKLEKDEKITNVTILQKSPTESQDQATSSNPENGET